MSDASLTTKIKAKMTLDDTIEARNIDVDTDGTVVTLSGTVRSDAERARGHSYVWGEVTDAAGGRASARLRGPEGYTLTALALN